MADRITINFTANTREVERGADRIADSLGDVEDALDDVGIGGEKSLEKATDATDDLAKSTDDVSGKVGDLGGAAKEALEGDFAGAASTAADSLSLLGPAGAAAGLVAVAGIEIVKGVLDQTAESAEVLNQKVADWAAAYIEAGNKIIGPLQVVAEAQAIVTDPERYKKAKEAAEDWGVSTGLAVLALAGDSNALAAAQASLKERTDEANKGLEEQQEQVTTASGAVYDLADSVERGQNTLDDLTGTMALGAAQADVYSEALSLIAENTEGASTVVDEFGDKITSLPDGTVIYIDAETGQATTDVDAIEKKVYGLPANTNLAITADTSQAEASIAALFTKKRTITAGFSGNGPLLTYGKPVI